MASLHLARLLRLITLVRSRVARNPRQLAAELDVGVRTVHRDLGVLGVAGMPCRFDRETGGYRMDGDFFLPPMQLTLTEAMAISVIGEEMGGRGQPLLKDAWRAVTKIRSQLPAAIRDDLARSDRAVKVHSARVSPQGGCEERFEILRQAIEEKRKVRCTYARLPESRSGMGGSAGDDDGRKPFLFRPYGLYFGQRAWYVIGHSEKSDGERTLKLNRFRSLQPTDRPYMVPDGWSVEKSHGKAWHMIRGDRRHIVKIRFDAMHAPNVADTLWHPTQRIQWQADGSCIFSCEVDGLEEIVWWIMGHGPHAEVISPVELRESVLELIDAMRRRYCSLQSGNGASPMPHNLSSKAP